MFLVGWAPTANRTLPDIVTGTHLEDELWWLACKRVSVGTDVCSEEDFLKVVLRMAK